MRLIVGALSAIALICCARLSLAAEFVDASSTAIVMIHTHQHRYTDLHQLDGIRTAFKQLAHTADPNAEHRDRIVLVTVNTPQWIISSYTADGLTVKPLNSFIRPHCAEWFNIIAAWNATLLPYERVLVLQHDVLVQRPIDRLFACGRYCFVYASLLHFTDAVILVKPDNDVLASMIQAYNADVDVSTVSQPQCQTESWHYFLHVLGDVEAAPLFDPNDEPLIQSDLPIQRMTASVALNAMMFYEFFNWRLMRGKGFRNFTDEMGVPAYALSFTTLKPFNWASGIFFNLNWVWHNARDQHLQRSYAVFYISAVLAVVGLAVWAIYGVKIAMNALFTPQSNENSVKKSLRWLCVEMFGLSSPPTQSRAMRPVTMTNVTLTSMLSLFHYWLIVLTPIPLAIILASVHLIVVGYILYAAIPNLTPPHLAWPLYMTLHALCTYQTLHIIALGSVLSRKTASNNADQLSSLHADNVNGGTAAVSLSLSPLPDHIINSINGGAVNALDGAQQLALPAMSFFTVMSPILFWSAMAYTTMRLDLYNEFVVKLFVLFPQCYALFLAHVNAWWYTLQQYQDLRNKRSS